MSPPSAANKKGRAVINLPLLVLPDIVKDETPEGVDDIRKRGKIKLTPGYDPGDTPEVDRTTPLLTKCEPEKGVRRTPEEIEEWIRDNYWRCDYPQHYVGHEINQPSESDFDTADLRVLCVRLSPYDAVSGSMTHGLLAMLARNAGKQYGFKVFTDQCTLPNGQKDIEAFKEGKMPLYWGRTTKRHALDFDVILTTIALTTEQVNFPWALRWSGIPIWKAERDDLTPLFFTGGVPSDNYEMMYGPVKDDTGRFREGMQDGTVIGEGEYSVGPMLEVAYRNRKEHWEQLLGDGWGGRSLPDIRERVKAIQGKMREGIAQEWGKSAMEDPATMRGLFMLHNYDKDWSKEATVDPQGAHRQLKAKILKAYHTTAVAGRTPGKDTPGIPGWYEPDAYQPHWKRDEKTGYNEYQGVTVKPAYREYVPRQVRRATVPLLDVVKTNEEGVVHYDNMGSSVDIQISAGCSSGGNCTFCVAEGMRVATGKAFTKIELVSVNEQEHVVETLYGKQTHQGLVAMGKRKCVTVKTKNQVYLTVTPDHKVQAWHPIKGLRDVEAGSLTHEDYVVEKRGFLLGQTERKKPRDFWYSVGWLYGDGSNTEGDRLLFLFAEGDAESKERIQAYWSKEIGEVYNWPVNSEKSGVETWEIHTEERKRKYLEVIPKGARGGVWRDEGVPELLWNSSVEEIGEFISAMFDADGTASRVDDNRANNISCWSTHRKLLADMQLLMLGLGIVTAIRPDNRTTKRGEEVTGYQLYVKGLESRKRFTERCNYHSPRKAVAAIAMARKTKRGYPTDDVLPGGLNYLRRALGLPKWKEEDVRSISAGWQKVAEMTENAEGLQDLYHLAMAGAYCDRVEEVVEAGELETYDLYNVEPSHHFLVNGVSVSNCHEANSGGRWRERSLAKIIEASERAIRQQGAEEITPYSFTWSYHSRVYSMLGWTYRRFGKCTLISQRADIASVDPEFFKIQRGTGKLAATIGVEGISQRIRDYLNKNCAEEQIINAVTHAAYAGFHTVKFFMIATGYETEEDVYEFCRLLDKLKAIGIQARDWRRKTQGVAVRDIVIKPSFMTLLHEPHTPLQFAECRAAMDLETDILRPVIDKCNEHGYLFKTSLKRKHVRVSQWFSLAGREATRSMLEMVCRYDWAHHGSIHEWVTWEVEQELKKDGYDWMYYFREKPWEHVFPWDHVITPMSREYYWKAFIQAINFRGVPYCLRTPANSNPKCWSCTACRTPEEKLSMLQRTYETSDLLKDIRAHTRRTEPVSKARWLLNIHEPLLRTAKKMVLGRHITRGMYLRASELGRHDIVESFLTIASHSLMQAENDQQRPWVMGRVLIDFYFNDRVREQELRDMIPYINAQTCMWGMKVEDVRVSPDMKPLATTQYFGLYELTIPDMTPIQVRNTLEQLNDASEVSIRRRVASGKETFRMEDVSYMRSDLVPGAVFGLSGDGRARVFFMGSSKESPYYMLETILKRRGTAWKKNPIICHGYYLLNKERGLDNGGQGAAGDLFAAFKKQKLWCELTGRPIETDLFTGQLYESQGGKNLSVLADVLHYSGREGWGAKARNWKIADREPVLPDIEDVAKRQVDEIEAIAADVKAFV